MKKNVVVIGLIVILLELFVYNFGFFKSMFYKEKIININEIKMYDLKENTVSNNYHIESDNSYFLFNINEKVNNIYLDIGIVFKKSISVEIDYTDDASMKFYTEESNIDNLSSENPKKKYSHIIAKNVEKSKYINCHHLGDTHSIMVSLENNVNKHLYINEIVVNKKVPLFVNYLRMCIIFLSIFIIYNYFNNDKFKNYFNSKYKYILMITIIIFSLLVIILYKNVSIIKINYDYYNTYYKDSLMNGNFDLDLEFKNDVIKKLDKLDNVYDFTERIKSTNYAFDTSYYNGKFYMYFGILPALLMGITNLSMTVLTCFFSVIAVIFSSLFLNLLMDRYCTKISGGMKILLIIFFLFNSRLLLLIPLTRFYEMLIVCGYSLCITGLYLFLKFDINNKKKYLFLGSLFLSLALMCRVNMIIVSIFGLFLIYKKLNKNNIYMYIIPYFIILSILMYINYIRFGNILDFGINYQLGIVDNSFLKLDTITILNGIYGYLFRFPIFNMVFPYIMNNISIISYTGFYFNNSVGNGIIAMSLIGLVIPFIRKKIDKETKKLFIVSIICGLLLLLINNTSGGLIKRYTLEFAWLFLIPVVIYSVKCFKNNKKALLILVIISCIINFLVIFDTKNDDLKLELDTHFYYKLMYGEF